MSDAPVILDARVLSGSGGGPDKTLISSPRFLARAGYRMLCAYLRDPADPGFARLRQKADVLGTALIDIPDRGPLDWRILPRMLAVCRRENVAVWHGHDYKSNLLGLLLRPFWPMRLVTTLHGWVHHTGRTPLYYLVDRLTLRFYEQVICVSDDLYRDARRAGVPAHKCLLLENGIDLEGYRRTRTSNEAKRALGLSPDRLLIGGAGRLSPEKGFDLLIDAVAQLLRDGRPVTLVLAGEGGERAALEARVGALGLSEQVRFLGFQTDLRGVYEALDLFALSSHREGLPNVLLEAMAMGVPVVATAVNGVPRLVTDGLDGLLVPAGSAEALAGALGQLCDDADARKRLAAAGRAMVERRFSFAVRMEKLARLYDDMFALARVRERRPLATGAA